MGAIDPAFANSTTDFSYTHVYPAARDVYDYWKIPIQSMTINGTSFALSRSRVHGAPSPLAVFDTGTTLILGPTADVDRLWASVGGAQKTDAGWQVRCDRAMVIGLVLGAGDSAQEYAVDPADLSWLDGGRDGNWCMGGIQGNDQVGAATPLPRTVLMSFSAMRLQVSSGDWLLGDTFLRVRIAAFPAGVSARWLTCPIAERLRCAPRREQHPAADARAARNDRSPGSSQELPRRTGQRRDASGAGHLEPD